MAQSLVLKIKGLYTSTNELSEAPEGALLQADNIDIAKDSIAEPRRGFERLETAYNTNTHRTARTFFYQDKQFAHHGSLGSEDKLSYLHSGSWTNVGTFSAPTGYRMRQLSANQNLYFTTAGGVKKLDAYNGTAVDAGAFKGLDLVATTTGSSGFLSDNNSVAYRIVWGYKDANNNLIIGAPSQREVVKNTAGSSATRDVSLTFTIPDGVTTSWFYQIYRSAETSADEPSDELGLVYEASPSSGDISTGTITVTDIVPDALRGATIYTAASQDGLAFQNERPPLAIDMAVFRESVFYANTTSRHRYFLTLLAVGGSNGIADNDTLTVGGVTYTGKSAENIASAEFKVESGGSAAQNIRSTALSLVRVINRHSLSTVYAYYLSGPDDLPGKLLFEERGLGGGAFTVTSSKTTCWNPNDFPDTSSNDRYKNGLFWSKPGIPEAVPLTNFVQVGSRESEIQRIIPLRDALYIFKTEGIYKLTGYYPSFSIDLLDSSARIVAPESLDVLNNQIFGLADQGVIVVSDGVKIVSRPIEQDLLRLFGLDLAGVQTKSWGIAYETERKYYLFTISNASETAPTQSYVFNVFTGTWVRHVLSATAGVVHMNRLYLGDVSSPYILRERKSYSYLDYADYGFSATITGIDSLVITLSDGVDNIAVGDILFESDTKFSTITAVDPIMSTVTVQSNPGFTDQASVDVLKAISTIIKWAPITNGNPAVLKQFHTAIPIFKADFNGTGYLRFASELSPFDEEVPVVGRGLGSWGLFAWGSAPWGGVSIKRPIRQWVPRNKQRASQLTVSFEHSYGFSPWQLQGLSLHGEIGSEKVSR